MVRIQPCPPPPAHLARRCFAGSKTIPTPILFVIAALLEIGGCFAFWSWWRLDRSVWWLLPGMAALAGFAWVLAQSDTGGAGRAYAAYGGVYVLGAVLWGWWVEGLVPDRFDGIGAGLCLTGCAVILFGPR
ncbi:YnfA family protein [Sphingomonas sp. Leaf4]|uniref:YnfA family protein n=1 Tax=Sphingomonas sp. Leaf4 TaxID=2876553 RepID=UPI002E79EAFF|nr:YnfA family protein [Sphingomonas sp. Leaf4]